MAQTGYTPIQLYLSTTASAVPTAGNLANGELAINITDGKLFYKDNGGVVQVLATKGAGTIGGSNTQVQYNNAGALAGSANLTFDGTTLTAAGLAGPHNGTVGASTPNTGAFTTLSASSTVTLSAGTANGVAYLNGSKVLTTGSGLQFDGTNVGVGVTPSAWSGVKAIQLNSNLGVYGAGTAEFGAVSNTYYNGTNWIYGATAVAARYAISAGQHQWFNAPSGTAGNAITFTQAMTLDASGNLGIGTTSPSGKFHTAFNNTGNQFAYLTNNQDANTGLSISTSTRNWWVFVGDSASNALRFYDATAAAERMRIDSNGNLLVGQTTTGAANANSFAIQVSTASMVQNHVSGTGSGSGYTSFAYNAGVIGSITQNGTTGVLYNLTSDYRLKNDQQPLTGAKEFVMALQPKKWQWWDGSGEGVGFIAHEFMEVAKYSGHGEKDAVDENGNIIAQSIQPSSSEVMANLVSLIQEQQAIITQLQADVAALKGQA